MLFDPAEYKKHTGSPKDLNYRAATDSEAARCRKLERIRILTIPLSILIVVVAIGFIIAIYQMKDPSVIIKYAAWIMLGIAVLNVIRYIVCFKKSESFEVAEAELVGYMEINNRPYVSVWCAKEEIYIKKLRFFTSFHRYQGMRLLVVKGIRSGNKKPYYFTISKDADPVTAS